MFLIKWCYDILFFNLGGAALMVLFHDGETSWPIWLPIADGVITIALLLAVMRWERRKRREEEAEEAQAGDTPGDKAPDAALRRAVTLCLRFFGGLLLAGSIFCLVHLDGRLWGLWLLTAFGGARLLLQGGKAAFALELLGGLGSGALVLSPFFLIVFKSKLWALLAAVAGAGMLLTGARLERRMKREGMEISDGM